jgi:hypothetical protein
VDWTDNAYRSSFVLELLMLHQVNPDMMMDMLYEALVKDGEQILNNGNSPEDIAYGLDQVIKWFEDNEKYEQCHALKQIKQKCLESK